MSNVNKAIKNIRQVLPGNLINETDPELIRLRPRDRRDRAKTIMDYTMQVARMAKSGCKSDKTEIHIFPGMGPQGSFHMGPRRAEHSGPVAKERS
ncbi:hypothetical protein Ddc_21006 [Ditylenchus destructor]|nr:hypothetical protein Ddc_21006 [Ditylenchus destructor]